MEKGTYKFTALKVTQPIGDFFVTKIPYKVIIGCASADIRRITERDSESRTGMQRPLNDQRVKEIGEYVKTIDATFPNSIILCLNSLFCNKFEIKIDNKINNNEPLYEFEVQINKNTFSIVDGQHRIAGFNELNDVEKNIDFELVSTIFMDMEIEDQAFIFSTINSTQRDVSKSVVYDLFELAETRSPNRTAHLITKALNSDERSPFYKRIALLGRAPKFENEILYRPFLNQGSVAGKISSFISNDSSKDRDNTKKGIKLETDTDNIKKGLIFRNYYIQEKDSIILAILWNYFEAVKTNFFEEWSDKNSPICKAIGFGALMKLLKISYKIGYYNNELNSEYFEKTFIKVRKNYDRDCDNTLLFKNYSPSGSGENQLYKDLLRWSELED